MEKQLMVTMTEAEFRTLIRQSVTEGVEDAVSRLKGSEQEGNMLKKKDAARVLSCSTSTIDNMARAGRLTRHYVGKKSVRFDRAQVLSIAEQTTYFKNKPNARR